MLLSCDHAKDSRILFRHLAARVRAGQKFSAFAKVLRCWGTRRAKNRSGACGDACQAQGLKNLSESAITLLSGRLPAAKISPAAYGRGS
eukprot:5687268-Prymnesium_polylepis.1